MLQIDELFPQLNEETRATLEAAPRNEAVVLYHLHDLGPLEAGDRLYVDSKAARSDAFSNEFLRKLGYFPEQQPPMFLPPKNGKHLLFFGHVGCGKSTELRRLSAQLQAQDRYWVTHVDLLKLIDPNNVRYCDVWLAATQALLKHLEDEHIKIEEAGAKRLYNWFTQTVLTHEKVSELSAELKTEIEAGYSFPLLGKLVAKFTSAFKLANTKRETIREVVNNSYGEFIGALNQLLAAITDGLQRSGKGQLPLLVIDGPDRFRGDDWRRFFQDEGIQVTQAQCVTIYTAPLALKHNGRPLAQFDAVILPMVKLRDFDDGHALPAAYDMMRLMLLKRAHYSMFADLQSLDDVIDYSGGNVRDALKLLRICCEIVERLPFDRATVEKAATKLAAEFRHWLKIEHYQILAQSDLLLNQGHSDDINYLIEEGALLEYNTGSWRQAHPVLRLLHPFKLAQEKLAQEALAQTAAADKTP
ncbi:hypothetical protein V8J88_19990 [Massilia sp. W12]|uniref:hypothetical protein n=1 Tax=Massilia sp. W12 TaxID=3126507 RepID=UPI0030CC52B8